MENNAAKLAALAKKRFGVEPGDDKYYEILIALGDNINYGAKKDMNKTKKSGLGGNKIQESIVDRETKIMNELNNRNKKMREKGIFGFVADELFGN